MAQAYIRLIHGAVDSPTVTVVMKDTYQRDSSTEIVAANLNYTEATTYLSIAPMGTLALHEDGEPIWQGTFDLQADLYYTGIFVSITDGTKLLIFPDTVTNEDMGSGQVRVINIAAGYTSLDVDLQDTEIKNETMEEAANTFITNVTFETASEYITVLAGAYNVLATMGGSKALPLITLAVNAGSVNTLVALGSADKTSMLLALVDTVAETEVLENDLDKDKFMGVWNQISSINGCPHPRTRFEYTSLCSHVKCIHRCHDKNRKKVHDMNGVCLDHASSKGAWCVHYGKERDNNLQPNLLIHQTDYITYAVVGTADRRRAWIYARKEKMDKDLYVQLLKACKSWGYNIDRMVVNYHALRN